MLKKFLLCLVIFISVPEAGSESPDPIVEFEIAYSKVDSYSVEINSSLGEVVNYSYKKTGHVRMDFIKPHGGAVIVYNPETNKVRVRPFGFIKPLVVTYKPESRVVRSKNGHQLNDSDLGVLLGSVKKVRDNGVMKVVGKAKIGDVDTVAVRVKAEGDFTDYRVNEYRLWLSKITKLPVLIEAFGIDGKLQERTFLNNIKLNPDFAEGFFII